MSHLFLTGSSGIGKSTIIQEVLHPLTLDVRGFFTQRLLFPDHTTAGFRLLSWEKDLPCSANYDPLMQNIFIRKTERRWEKDLSVFSDAGVSLLENCLASNSDAASCDFPSSRPAPPTVICLDEIGGTELLVPKFRTMLYKLLEESPCCIGVVKSTENLTSMFTRVSMNRAEESLLLQLHEDLLHRFNSQILSVTESNREYARRILTSFLDDAAKKSQRPPRQSPNIHAGMDAWPVARGNK